MLGIPYMQIDIALLRIFRLHSATPVIQVELAFCIFAASPVVYTVIDSMSYNAPSPQSTNGKAFP